MLFNSVEFFVFFPIVLAVYLGLTVRYQNAFLLIASYVFYGFWDARFLLLIFLSTLIDFVVGSTLAKTEKQSHRKLLLGVSLLSNLGILGFFKYFDFFVDSLVAALSHLGVEAHMPTLRLLLPVGISFYTFQTLSYTFDIYRRTLEPTRDFLTFALFVAYFPQLVAGPIERAKDLLPRLSAARSVTWPGVAVGLELMLIGYLKKVGVADTLGPIVDARFQNPGSTSGSGLLLSAYLFSIQIYCDFSGYSDIARGVSKLFGIPLMRNFNQPYLSTTITEFWRRWHISLSSWLRDYLYIALGGNRKGTVKTYRNLMLTMLLGGYGTGQTGPSWFGAGYMARISPFIRPCCRRLIKTSGHRKRGSSEP